MEKFNPLEFNIMEKDYFNIEKEKIYEQIK